METIKRKSMLYKSAVEFEDYSMNHVWGCSHGCSYPCYARLIKKASPENWIKPKIVENTLELLDKEIPLLKDKIKQVHLCFSTDPFMYNQSEIIDLSLKVIEKLISNDINIKVLTKGILSYKIIDLEMKNIGHKNNHYGISLVSIDENFRNKFEPGASNYKDRIRALSNLSCNGDCDLYTYVYIEPFNPELISMNEFRNMLNYVSFVNKIYFGSWQYNKKYSNSNKYKEYTDYIIEFCSKNEIELKLKKELLTKTGDVKNDVH